VLLQPTNHIVNSELVITIGNDKTPIQIAHNVNGNTQVLFNGKSLLTVESVIRRATPPAPVADPNNANNTISYSAETALGLDFTFVDSKHVFGIPERATDLMLKPTRYVIMSHPLVVLFLL